MSGNALHGANHGLDHREGSKSRVEAKQRYKGGTVVGNGDHREL